MPIFNDFDFQIALARRRGAKSIPTPSVFDDFDFQIALARRRGANFGFNFKKSPAPSDTLSF